ncbi:flagellar FliL protein [Gammaproteobacteria bacterium]
MKKVVPIFLAFVGLIFSHGTIASGDGGGGKGGGANGNYLEITPPFVVNMPDSKRSRFMQVTVAVSAKNEETLKGISVHAPLIRNNLILLFTNQTADVATSREVREKLRKDAEETINKALKEVGLAPIDALYFTNLVIQ